VGKSSAVEVLLNYLKSHHADVARRVKKVDVVDLSALSEAEIEAVVKRSFSTES